MNGGFVEVAMCWALGEALVGIFLYDLHSNKIIFRESFLLRVESVKGIEEGDTVILVFRPNCIECVDCKSTQSNMCYISSKRRIEGLMKSDNGTRFNINGKPIYHFVGVSSFSEFTVVGVDQVVKINPMVSPDKVCLLRCGVTTGLGGAWKVRNVEKGSSVAVFGLGTIGMAVSEGARIRVVSRIIGVDVKSKKFDIGTELQLDDFITHEISFPEINKAFELLMEGEFHSVRVGSYSSNSLGRFKQFIQFEQVHTVQTVQGCSNSSGMFKEFSDIQSVR
ncbi:alcohol dehydrogenase-like 7 [Cryptomeria japonica]|uniref:alcohol dehydrogenase-like 7 n=1 Tax=Cryptomeria japonica TaxID=3369 RepID=UPI0027DA1C86|nr:alcohol dehydrogenase-like 7 [Cryptomeria japonica]